MALEKRYNFSLSDFDVVANGFSLFRSYVRDEDGKHIVESGNLRFFCVRVVLANYSLYGIIDIA